MAKHHYPDPETWVDEYGEYLFRFAMLRLRDAASAEDAVQETFLAAVKGLERYDGRVAFKYWLRAILRNKVVDHVRKSVREDVVEDTETKDLLENFWFKHSGVPTRDPKPWDFEPRKAFEKEEFWEVFRDCLSKLKGPTQQAFALKMLEGQSTEEVCKILDISANNLWVMMHRARAQLKDCLEQKWGRRTTI